MTVLKHDITGKHSENCEWRKNHKPTKNQKNTPKLC